MPAIVFDLDGTLIDSAPDIHATANRVLAEAGLQTASPEVVRGFIGRGVGHLLACLLRAQGQPGDGAAHAAMVARFEALYDDAVTLTRPYPGVAEALDALTGAGHVLGICTNKPARPARAILHHLGLADRFDVILGGDSLPQRKPDPAPLHATFAALGDGPGLFVGDSEVDAETAARAGVPFALFTEGYRHAPVDALPHTARFADFADLPGIAARVLRA